MPQDNQRSQLSWAFYDWANSAFATTVMAGFFPLFFKQYWSAGTDPTISTFWLGLGNSGASFLILLMAPLLGAMADSSGRHKRLLALFAGLGIIATAAFFLVGEGAWPWAISIYVIAIIGFSGANVFYDAMLPRLTDSSDFHRLSALGYSLGYLGGGLLFLVNVTMTLKPAWFGLPDAAAAVRFSFLSVALWWLVFSLPLLLGVREQTPISTTRVTLRDEIRKLLDTLRSMRRHRNLWLFLWAYWLYIDGVATIIRMAVDYGIAIGLPANSLIVALLLVQFIGFPATLLFGRIGQRYGAKRGLWIGLWAYVIATFCATFMSSALEFYLLAVALGLVQGGVQSLSRSLFGQLIPAERAGEYFGFLNMLGKAAAVLGPLMVGVVAATTGNSRIGLLSILLLFLLGMWFLRKVDDSITPQTATTS
ncbi:MFS transporter [Granulosicoccus sp. 3-233]|uniref:MFS transporter n=1 Tax=Granulosicoccus sp. 3-233 TaxID=3417969 RepID=UPI003D34F8DA